MTLTEQEQLYEWKNKYCPNDLLTIRFIGYEELAITDGFRMGKCQAYWGKDVDGNLLWMRCDIYLDDDHEKCPKFFRDATLWHEFCHAWDAIDNIHVDHCSKFQRKKWKKPAYAIGDIVLKLIGWVWFD